MKYLGYVVDRNGLYVDPDKVKAMFEISVSTTVSEVKLMVRTFSWYRSYVQIFLSTSKLAPKFDGPYCIKTRVSSCTFEMWDSNYKRLRMWGAKDFRADPPDPVGNVMSVV